MQKLAAGRIIVVEGVCSVGKTTVLEAILRPGLVAGVTLLNESVRLVEDMPPLPTTPQEARRNETFFIDLDARRWSMARLWCAEGRNVVAERDLFGTLSISYGYDPFFDSFDYAAARALELLRQAAFEPLPAAYVWLRASDTALQRRIERATTRHVIGPGFTDAVALARQEAFLAGYFASIEAIVPVLSVDADAPADRVVPQVAACLESALRLAAQPPEAYRRYAGAVAEYLQSPARLTDRARTIP